MKENCKNCKNKKIVKEKYVCCVFNITLASSRDTRNDYIRPCLDCMIDATINNNTHFKKAR